MVEISKEELERRAEITATQLGGIQAIHRAFYQLSMRYSYERAQASFQRYDQLTTATDSASELIAAAQEAVSHTAALSRFFFPSYWAPKSHRKTLRFARAERLRQNLEV